MGCVHGCPTSSSTAAPAATTSSRRRDHPATTQPQQEGVASSDAAAAAADATAPEQQQQQAAAEKPEKVKRERRSRSSRAAAHAHAEVRLAGSFANKARGEQVAAGWPAWLSAVAGEAIDGWTPRRADSFEKIDKIGQGTYNNVYKARDSISGKIVALKKVRFDNLEPESVRFMAREILILRPHPLQLRRAAR